MEQEKNREGGSFGSVALGTLAGLAVGMAATYAVSGDSLLLRRNLHKAERSAERALHTVEKHLR